MARGGKNREKVSKMRVRDLVCFSPKRAKDFALRENGDDFGATSGWIAHGATQLR